MENQNSSREIEEKEKSLYSGSGEVIKIVATIILIFSVISSFILMRAYSVAAGIAWLIGTTLFSLMTYGIGEIVCYLREINRKME